MTAVVLAITLKADDIDAFATVLAASLCDGDLGQADDLGVRLHVAADTLGAHPDAQTLFRFLAEALHHLAESAA